MGDVEPKQDTYTQFWNEVLAPKFERFKNILLGGLSYHGVAPLARMAIEPGMRVMDVGCGWGDTAIELARRVGPQGEVLGLDCTDVFLQAARADAARANVANVRFVAADVQTYRFDGPYDACFSRFGMMFFASPVAAMRNVRSALKPGATLMFITWRALADNAFLGMPKTVVSRFLPPPGDDAQTCGPGPFSMANPDVVSAQLKAAGFVDYSFERIDGPVMIGRDVDQAVEFQLALGPAGEIFREAGALAEARREEIVDALKTELSRHARPDGVWMDSSSWTICARNPG